MKTMPFFKFDSAEWLSGKVQLLSHEEKGIFIDLLALIWKNSGSIENNRILPRLLHLETHRFSEIIQAFLELQIIEENESVLSVKFLNVQVSEYNEFCEKQSRNGRKGGRPENPKKATGFQVQNSENPKKATESQKEKEKEEETETETEKKMLSCESIKENSHIAEISSSSLSRYPETVEEVLEIAERPEVAAMMTRTQAEAYFINRQATNWIDGLGRKVLADRVWADIKRWCSRDEERKNAGTSVRKHNMGNVTQEQLDAVQRIIDGDNAD